MAIFGRGFPIPVTIRWMDAEVRTVALAGTADATGSVGTATFQVRVNAGVATATGVVSKAGHGAGIGTATGTGVVTNATTGSGARSAPAGVATATGSVGTSARKVASKPTVASITGSVTGATIKKSTAGTATGTVTLSDPDTNWPIVRGRVSGSNQTNSTSHTITLPVVRSGDLLLVAFSTNNAPICYDASGTWTRLGQQSYSNKVTGAVFWRRATGTDTLTVTTDLSVMSTHISYSIKGARNPVGTVAAGNSTNADPPAVLIY